MKSKTPETRIMTFGTFDGLHKGHQNFFKQARKLAQNPYLIVSIARDINVKRIKKAHPELSERARMNLVKKSEFVDRVVLSGVSNYIAHIVKEHPDIIALGYDQREYLKTLKQDLKKYGLATKIVRLKPFQEKIYKNHLLKKR